MNRKQNVFLVLLSALTFGCASSSKNDDHGSECLIYRENLSHEPIALFSKASLKNTKNLKQAIHDFQAGKQLPNGKIYGDSVRYYSIADKALETLDQDLKEKSCEKKISVIKNPKTNEAILGIDGQSIPLWVYVCDDGGFFRIKPKGDLTSRFLPHPHGSKGVRYPFNGPIDTFSDELFKVNDLGAPVPKWPNDLEQKFSDNDETKQYLGCWSKDVHMDVKVMNH